MDMTTVFRIGALAQKTFSMRADFGMRIVPEEMDVWQIPIAEDIRPGKGPETIDPMDAEYQVEDVRLTVVVMDDVALKIGYSRRANELLMSKPQHIRLFRG